MGYLISKILHYLLIPPANLLFLMLAGLLLLRRHQRAGRALLAIGVIFLYLVSLPLVADIIIRPLEAAYPPLDGPPPGADAVIVLGGGVRNLSWVPAAPAPSDMAIERLVKGVELARKLHIPLVTSGGTGEIGDPGVHEADAMAAVAARLGMPRKGILTESRSRNTLENARETRNLITGRTVILVTSAFHMKRAAAMFAKAGFEVIPAPVGHRSQTRPISPANLLPETGHLLTSSIAISEYLSLAWYSLRGVI